MTPSGSVPTEPRARGRRPGSADTRAAIVDAARKSFAAKGYDRTSLRGIARDVGVDPALVHHYFEGGKGELFTTTQSVQLNPAAMVERIATGDRSRIGWRAVETFISVWDAPERRDVLVGLIRTGVATDDGARMLREFLTREVFGRIAQAAGAEDPQLRGSLAASQLIGLAVMRYVIRAPAIVGLTDEQVVAHFGPVIQLHLVDSGVSQA